MPGAVKKSKPTVTDVDAPDFDVTKLKRIPNPRAGERLELPLSGVRMSANKTQVDVSKASGIPQGEVSKIENRDDLAVISIATLRKYVAALGGELDLVARFPNGARIVIKSGA
ncbi:MAG: helix-turn-helix domain-containing protein [Polyangiaceae bacterium]